MTKRTTKHHCPGSPFGQPESAIEATLAFSFVTTNVDLSNFRLVAEKSSAADEFNRPLSTTNCFQEMTQALQKNGGIVDRFIGDAVQAYFLSGPDEPSEIKTLKAGRDMMAVHQKLRKRCILFLAHQETGQVCLNQITRAGLNIISTLQVTESCGNQYSQALPAR